MAAGEWVGWWVRGAGWAGWVAEWGWDGMGWDGTVLGWGAGITGGMWDGVMGRVWVGVGWFGLVGLCVHRGCLLLVDSLLLGALKAAGLEFGFHSLSELHGARSCDIRIFKFLEWLD